jgi:acyl-CoA thioester hydrolase
LTLSALLGGPGTVRHKAIATSTGPGSQLHSHQKAYKKLTIMTQKAEFPFFHLLRVRYAEVDAQAVVYNAHYVTYFDIAITEFLRMRKVDYSIATAQRTGKDFHTVRVTIDYAQPAHYDDELAIGVRVVRIGRSSITWKLAIFRNDNEGVIAHGEVVWVYTDRAAQRSTPLPAELIAAL